jgi:hypothetical protein
MLVDKYQKYIGEIYHCRYRDGDPCKTKNECPTAVFVVGKWTKSKKITCIYGEGSR